MSLRKNLEKIRADAQSLARKVKEDNKPAIEAARTQAAKIREELGLSDRITTDAVVAAAGPKAIAIDADNASTARERLDIDASVSLQPGDVVWPIDTAVGPRLCVVSISKKIGSMRAKGAAAASDVREGGISLLHGRVFLHSGDHRFDMTTGRRGG